MGKAGKDDLEWIERVKSEGNIPHFHPDNCSSGWASPPGDKFMVRGPNYFSTKEKVPGGNYLLKPLGFDWIRSSAKIGEILNHPNNRIQKAIHDSFPAGQKPFVWAFNLQLPSRDNYNSVSYFTSTEPVKEGSLMDRFLKGDDHFRNSRLKLIANVVNGPLIVKKAIGNPVCIIGHLLSCKYIKGENFFEVDIDVGSNIMAKTLFHLVLSYFTTLTIDMAFLIESKTDAELPERLLGCLRFSGLNPDSAVPMEPSSIDSASNLHSAVHKRLWKSIGQGFSSILHSGSQESDQTIGSDSECSTATAELHKLPKT